MLRTSSIAALLVALGSAALAAETTATIDRNGMSMVGTLNLPDGVENPPVVLMLLGFTGGRRRRGRGQEGRYCQRIIPDLFLGQIGG